ncbi:hypothetical protein Hanom_Chr15g01382241 [Helianthus anomalus]
MFSAWGSVDIVFKTAKGVSVIRSPLESLVLGITVHIAVISAWAELLNYEERFIQNGSISRLFSSVNMLNEKDYKSTEEIRATTFTENMESVL